MSAKPTASDSQRHDYLYRSGIGVMMINSEKRIFVGKRIDNNSDAWQMPQGGIDAGEDEDVAMLRELCEETGIVAENVRLVQKSASHHYYNLPYKLQKKFWGGKYMGQRQRWYLLEFIGEEKDINIATEHPEFSHWKWMKHEDLTTAIVPFKRELYEKVIAEFLPFLQN